MQPSTIRRLGVLAGALLVFATLLPTRFVMVAVAQTSDANLSDERIKVINWRPGDGPVSFNIRLSPGETTIVGASVISENSALVMRTVVAGQPVMVKENGKDVVRTPTVSCTGQLVGAAHGLQFCKGSIDASNYKLTVIPGGNAGSFAVFLKRLSDTFGDPPELHVNSRGLDASPFDCPKVEKLGVTVYQYGPGPLGSDDKQLLFRVRSGSALAYGRLFNQSGSLICVGSGLATGSTRCTVSSTFISMMYMVVIGTQTDKAEPVETMLRRSSNSAKSCFDAASS